MADSESTPQIISRKEAKRLGLAYYFTGRPCKYGHVALRRVTLACCRKCERVRLRRRRRENPEHYRARDRAYARQTGKAKKDHQRRYAKDRLAQTERVRGWYARNREYKKAQRRALYGKIRSENPVLYTEVLRVGRLRMRQWARDNPEQYKANLRNTQAKRKNSKGTHTAADIATIFKAQRGKCAYCRVKLGKKHHVDHILAIANGGTNDRRNLQLLCIPCNLTKGKRDPIVHARSLGMLL